MPTPSIQTLTTDAQQVLNLDSISAVRSVVAVALANANTGTPLNPNLTTQQLWDQFYQVVTKPKSDIESIIANQLMKFLYAPPAPGGAGADKQVIFNDGGVLAGDADFLWNKTTNLLTVTGAATITGDLTVDTSTLKVDSANNRVGIGTASPSTTAHIVGGNANTLLLDNGGQQYTQLILQRNGTANTGGDILVDGTGATINYRGLLVGDLVFQTSTSAGSPGERYRIASNGIATWSNVGGVAGTAMTLNSTGLGVGASPSYKLDVAGTAMRIRSASAYSALVVSSQDSNAATRNWAVASTFNNYGDLCFVQSNAQNGDPLTAGTVRFQIDSSGNVGIGVTPSAWSATFRSLDIGSGTLTSQPSQQTIGLYANAFENGTNYTRKALGFAAGYNIYNGAHYWLNAASGAAGSTFAFGSAVMTLDASGNLLVGTTGAAGGRLDVQAATGDCTAQFKSNAAGSNVVSVLDYVSSYGITRIKKSGTTVWETGVIGSTSATPSYSIFNASAVGVYLTSGGTSWTATSDERLKDIIEPISNAVAKVGSLRSVIGKFKNDAEGTRRSFLIAQDVQSVLPEAVDASNPGRLGVAYSEVIPLLVAAIKELTARVQTLETR